MYAVAYIASAVIPVMVVWLLWGYVIKFILNLPEHHNHYLLRHAWILKPGPNDTKHRPQSTMYGFVVPSSYIYMLAVYIPFMLSCVAGIFWLEFLLEETSQHSCNPSEVECFFIKKFWNILIEPIDCNHVARRVSGNPTFTCFKYKFDFTGASLTAGPVLGFSAAIIKVLPICFLFLKRYETQMYKTLQYPIALLCLLISLVLFILAVRNLFKFGLFLKLFSISSGILVSLTIPFLNFQPIPESRDQYLNPETNT